jgi:hypothetical protein
LFKYQEFDFTDRQVTCDLWRDSDYDKVLSKILDNYFGPIEVNFAVYGDSVEAHLRVMLTNCSFSWAKVHGTITASNSLLQNPMAVSYVFKKEKTEADGVIIGPRKEILLPLSRPVVALPFGSIFILSFNLSSEGEPIICHPFEFQVQLSGDDEQTFQGIGCGVKINVKYVS